MKRHGEITRINGKRVASPEYRSWQMMKNRCQNTNAEDFDWYGGRGIMVCDDWQVFDLFLEDMGRRPSILHTLDRINNNGHYCKDNCRWATKAEQSRNRGDYNTMDMETADKIRVLYETGAYTQNELATGFELTQTDISQVTRNVRWAREQEASR